MRRFDWRLMEDYRFSLNPQDSAILPAGSYVCPVEYKWLPSHIKSYVTEKMLVDSEMVYCYTKYGFMPISRKILRLV